MTTLSTQQESLGSALAELWQRHRGTNLDRISLLETTTANVLREVIDADGILAGATAAHQLAGSLGTFGFDAGSRAALQAECLLGEAPIDGRRLAEAVTTLRYSVEEVSPLAAGTTDVVPAETVAPPRVLDTLVVSGDIDLMSRLTAEAAAFGMTMAPLAENEDLEGRRGRTASVVIDEAGFGPGERGDLLSRISECAHWGPVTVLSDNDGFDARMELVSAGASNVVPRSLGAHEVIRGLAESIAQHSSGRPNLLTLNVDTRWSKRITESLKGFDCHSSASKGRLAFWRTLASGMVDLVVIGAGGQGADGADVCRTIRADAASRRIPVVMVGDSTPRGLTEALSAGADNYLDDEVETPMLGAWLRRYLESGHEARVHDTMDFSTGTSNRQALDGSLERLLRRSLQNGAPFSLALVQIDQFVAISKHEGAAMGAVALHGLAAQLQSEFAEDGVVGRWSDDGFGVGISECPGDVATERVMAVAKRFAEQDFQTTSGRVGRYTISAGIASAPIEGSSILSLRRVSESALQRARGAEDSVLLAGGRPSDREAHVVDVVVIEDDDSVADVIEHALGLRNFDFLRFSDGAEAARVLGEGLVRANVVLLDVGLPSLDGFGVLQVLQAQGVLSDTRVIMLTARSSEAEMLRALGLGAMEHITKPFSIPVLLSRLDKSVSRHTT
jgi:diguanylate cyclase (GGDEF)-like protein